jgi:hypothetical protein
LLPILTVFLTRNVFPPESSHISMTIAPFRGFSLEKLCNLLTLLGRDIDIVIKDRKQGGIGHFRVTHA